MIKVYKVEDLDEHGEDRQVLIGDKFDVADFFSDRDNENEEMDEEAPEKVKHFDYNNIEDLEKRASMHNYRIELVCIARTIRE